MIVIMLTVGNQMYCYQSYNKLYRRIIRSCIRIISWWSIPNISFDHICVRFLKKISSPIKLSIGNSNWFHIRYSMHPQYQFILFSEYEMIMYSKSHLIEKLKLKLKSIKMIMSSIPISWYLERRTCHLLLRFAG